MAHANNIVDLTETRARLVPVDYGERSLGTWYAMEFFYTDFVATTDAVRLIEIPANSFVANVFLVIEEAFVGGTVTLMVGTDADPNGYLAETDVGAATAGNVVATVPNMNAADVTGVYALRTASPFYTTADTLDVEFAFNSTATAGKATLIAEIVTVPR